MGFWQWRLFEVFQDCAWDRRFWNDGNRRRIWPSIAHVPTPVVP